jgi:hypothetical protein
MAYGVPWGRDHSLIHFKCLILHLNAQEIIAQQMNAIVSGVGMGYTMVIGSKCV